MHENSHIHPSTCTHTHTHTCLKHTAMINVEICMHQVMYATEVHVFINYMYLGFCLLIK